MFLDGRGKVSLRIFHHLLPKTPETRIRLDLDRIWTHSQMSFIKVLFTVKFRVCEYDVPCAMCFREIVIVELSEKVESCSSSTKNIISTTTMLMAVKLDGLATHHEELPPIKSHNSLSTWSLEIT